MSDGKFVHLHNHSSYSLLDGLSSPKELVACAVSLGFKALALTDHGSCAGLLQFQKACQKNGIKPILGMEAYFTKDHTIKDKSAFKTHHLTLLAKNEVGYKNLIYLSSFAYTQGFYYKPRLDFDILEKHKEGLIVTSACPAGEIPYLLWEGQGQEAINEAGKFKEVFGDDFYIELMMHRYDGDSDQEKKEIKLATSLYKLAKKVGVKVIATNDTHYAMKDDWNIHDVLLAIQTHDHIKNPDRFSFRSKDFYLKPYEEMAKRYDKAPEAITNTLEIAEKIESDIIKTAKDLLPKFNLPVGYEVEADYLVTLVENGMRAKGLMDKPLYRKRMEYELGIITQCKYEKYFLILWDIINFANREGIRVGIGRGCFLPNNRVQIADGTKTIQDIRKGDEVLSYDGELHEVTNTMKYAIDEEIIDIVMEDGRHISCTLDHKIHILRDGQLEWIEANKIKENDEIFDINVGEKGRKVAKIKSISRRKYKGDVYDIAVSGIHAYNIEGLSVHNSAVSSLCLYVLGITKLDPLKYDLIFERFLNLDRISPPDVDIDFDYDRREEVFAYVLRKYGIDHCSKIGTYNSYKARAAIRYTAKALDIGKDWETYLAVKKQNPNNKVAMTKNSLDLADEISKKIPLKAATIKEALHSEEELRMCMKRFPDLFKVGVQIEGVIASAGIHPAGVIACKDIITDHIPLRVSHGVVCSQYDMTEVEELGLLKFDLLALKTLTVVDRTDKMIKERYPNNSEAQSLDVDLLDPNDPKVFAMLNGKNPYIDTRGVFQFEADGISKLLRDIRVDSFDDMVVANALYRPGPLGAHIHNMYCDYKHGRKEIEYLHPKMGEALNDTYGMMIFQENIMRVAQFVAGLTGGQSDILRYAVGKKKAELMKKQKEVFIQGCVENDVDKATAVKIFAQIDKFAGYGFNKSHSAAYAFLAYQTAYLKIYYFLEFMCNLLTSEINNNDKDEKLGSYIRQLERKGYRLHPPNINKSGKAFTIIPFVDGENKETLLKPLTMLKGVGEKAVDDIIEKRPFRDLTDFLQKVDGKRVNAGVFKTLVAAGCFRGEWKESSDTLLSRYENTKKEIAKERKNRKKQTEEIEKYGGGSLFD